MPNYQDAKIYKLVCNDTGLTYFGSTTQPLQHRLAQHKSATPSNGMNCSSRQIFKNDNYRIELVEDYPCDNKVELLIRETEYIKNNECVNRRCPYRTNEEVRQRARERYAANREEFAAIAIQKYHDDPSKSRAYYLANREIILQKVKNRYQIKKHLKEVELQA